MKPVAPPTRDGPTSGLFRASKQEVAFFDAMTALVRQIVVQRVSIDQVAAVNGLRRQEVVAAMRKWIAAIDTTIAADVSIAALPPLPPVRLPAVPRTRTRKKN